MNKLSKHSLLICMSLFISGGLLGQATQNQITENQQREQVGSQPKLLQKMGDLLEKGEEFTKEDGKKFAELLLDYQKINSQSEVTKIVTALKASENIIKKMSDGLKEITNENIKVLSNKGFLEKVVYFLGVRTPIFIFKFAWKIGLPTAAIHFILRECNVDLLQIIFKEPPHYYFQ